MAGTGPVRRRSGGRSARVRSAVLQAADDLLGGHDADQITIAEVAARAGVNPTSIYRRWGTLEALVLDLEATRLQVNSPMPDTGTLRGDLLAYAANATRDITRPGGLAFLRAVLATRDARSRQARAGGRAGHREDDPAWAPVRARGAQLRAMLARARERATGPAAYRRPRRHPGPDLPADLAGHRRPRRGPPRRVRRPHPHLLAGTSRTDPRRMTMPHRTNRSRRPPVHDGIRDRRLG